MMVRVFFVVVLSAAKQSLSKAESWLFFFFNDTATTEIYTLSLHDALPISPGRRPCAAGRAPRDRQPASWCSTRSEEQTSELQSRFDLVCRLLLEKKNRKTNIHVIKKKKYKKKIIINNKTYQ